MYTIRRKNTPLYKRRGIGFIYCALLLIAAGSCRKDQYPATPAQSTLTRYIRQDTGLSLFRAALTRAGLDSILASGGPYTVFAPVNGAFNAAGLGIDRINGYDPQVLRSILGFHILPGRIGSATVTGFISDSMQCLDSLVKPIITQNYYGLFMNGIKVTQGNITLGDGVLHKIGALSFPPTGTLIQTLDSLPYTSMAAYIFHHSPGLLQFALNPAGLFQPSVQGKASYNTWYNGQVFGSVTLLIPDDDAFRKYGYNSIADLAALDTVSRTNLLYSGFLFGSFFTADFVGGRWVGNNSANNTSMPPLPCFNGRMSYYDGAQNNDYQIFITSGGYEFGNDGLSIYASGTVTPPKIIHPNVLATNGVLHILDQILTPNGDYYPSGPGQ